MLKAKYTLLMMGQHPGCLHVRPVSVWLLYGFSGFLPLSKNMHVWGSGNSLWSIGVYVSVNRCLSWFVSVGPCDKRATRLWIRPAFILRQLKEAPADPRDPGLGKKRVYKC